MLARNSSYHIPHLLQGRFMIQTRHELMPAVALIVTNGASGFGTGHSVQVKVARRRRLRKPFEGVDAVFNCFF